MSPSIFPLGKLLNADFRPKFRAVNIALILLLTTCSSCSQGFAQTPPPADPVNEQRESLKQKREIFAKWEKTEEGLAFSVAGNKNTAAKNQFMAKLSPGGKIYFLTCRQDYSEALKLLDAFAKRDTGSGLYVRAKCLDGMHRRLEAISAYTKARAKIGKNFDPGSRFNLHLSSAQAAAGQDIEAIKNLKIAIDKSSSADQFSTSRAAVVTSALKRLFYLEEKKGKYQSAFEHYLSLNGTDKSQFTLNEPITADGAIRAKANKWLKEHPAPPKANDPLARCKYFTTAAKAHLASGNSTKAKDCLIAALEHREPSANNLPAELTADLTSPFRQAKEVAGNLLITLDLKDKDYKSACKHIRSTFVTDPAREDQLMLVCLSMKDVAELVTARDRALHSTVAEERLDYGSLNSK